MSTAAGKGSWQRLVLILTLLLVVGQVVAFVVIRRSRTQVAAPAPAEPTRLEVVIAPDATPAEPQVPPAPAPAAAAPAAAAPAAPTEATVTPDAPSEAVVVIPEPTPAAPPTPAPAPAAKKPTKAELAAQQKRLKDEQKRLDDRKRAEQKAAEEPRRVDRDREPDRIEEARAAAAELERERLAAEKAKADLAAARIADEQAKAIAAKQPTAPTATKPAGSPDVLVYVLGPGTPSPSIEQIRNVYLGRTTVWGNGSTARPMNRPPGSGAGKKFFGRILGMDGGAFQEHWSGRQLTGGGISPAIVSSAASMIAKVRATAGGFGYVLESELPADVTGLRLVRLK